MLLCAEKLYFNAFGFLSFLYSPLTDKQNNVTLFDYAYIHYL